MTDALPTYVKINLRFKTYEKYIFDAWETYNLILHYMELTHIEIKNDNWGGLPIPAVWNDQVKTIKKNNTYGAISHLVKKSNPRRSLSDLVSIFEVYLSDLTTLVYEDFPGKQIGKDSSKNEDGYHKILKHVIDSEDKNEIINRVVEEKVRGIFYGRPSNYFNNEKLEFGNYFSDNFKKELEIYEEITARRNIVVHNDGRVDRKYGSSAESVG